MARACVDEGEQKSLGQQRGCWLTDWMRWRPTSMAALEESEKKILSYLKRPYECNKIDIETDGTKPIENSLWSIKMNESQTGNTPLVLLHGFASGIALWILNLDALSAKRPLYTFDLLGFGRSSRPVFNKDSMEAENQLVQSIEEWRKKTGLEKFILLGHSMGGYLASSYALKYPEHVHHLILADPWGFPERQEGQKNIRIPLWLKAIASLMKPFNPLAGLRAAGPWGPQLVEKLRPDLIRKFSSVVDDHEVISNYIYHCNAQEPSGESAFKSMSFQGGWAKHPMITRIAGLHKDIPITFIYGSRSWIDSTSGMIVKEMRPDSYVDVKMIMGAGHHVYADRASEFNSLVQNVCRRVDYKTKNLKLSVEEDLGPNIISSEQKSNMKESVDEPVEVAGGPIFFSPNS